VQANVDTDAAVACASLGKNAVTRITTSKIHKKIRFIYFSFLGLTVKRLHSLFTHCQRCTGPYFV
jgi:hypothetical protein